MFLERNGAVEQKVTGVLSGWALRCQRSKDPYFRVDQAKAHSFLQCVVANQNHVTQAAHAHVALRVAYGCPIMNRSEVVQLPQGLRCGVSWQGVFLNKREMRRTILSSKH